MLFKNKNNPSKNPVSKEREALQIEDALHLLKTNLGIISLEKEMRSFMITSALDNEGNTGITLGLAARFASPTKKILVVDINRQNSANHANNSGLKNIIQTLFMTSYQNGTLDQMTVTDFILIAYFQSISGKVTFFDQNNIATNAHFENGMLCLLEKNQDSTHSLLLKNMIRLRHISEEQANLLKQRCQITGASIFKAVCELTLLPQEELRAIMEFELLNGIKELMSVPQMHFTVTPISTDHIKPIAQILGSTYHSMINQLNDHEFINQTIFKSVVAKGNNLFVMPFGESVISFAEVFSPKRLEKLLRFLRKQYDFVFFDTTPITQGIEASVVGSVTDGTLLVIKKDHAARQKIQRSINRLRQAKVNIVGAVLNDASTKRKRHNYTTQAQDTATQS